MADAINYDVDGYTAINAAILALINQFPGLSTGDEIMFSSLDADGGKALYALSSPVIQNRKQTITGRVIEDCEYPFIVIYRAGGLNETMRKAVETWLDNLGKWLEQNEITIDGEAHKLSDFPTLTGNREIKSITRQTPAVLDSINENGTENWTISLLCNYKNEYEVN